MTKEDLKEILDRHNSDETDGEADPADTHEDRGRLLKFLKTIAITGCMVEKGDGAIYCHFCGLGSTHHPECMGPALEILVDK